MIKNINSTTYKTLHWYQLPLSEFSFKLEQEFKQYLFKEIYKERQQNPRFAQYINQIAKKYGKNWTLKSQRHLIWEYKNHTKFIPAWYVFECCKYLKIELNLIESKISSYISFRGKVEITDPIFPIIISPLMTSVVAHILGDGSHANKKFSYYQKKKHHLKRFRDIVELIFGKYNAVYKKSCYTPKIFSDIISDEYKIYNYGTFESKIPKKIFSMSKTLKLAFYCAFLLDEGCVLGNVHFYSSNLNLIKGLIKLGKSLGYSFKKLTVIKPTGKSKFLCYRLILRQDSIFNFYQDLTNLFDVYPILKIGGKYDKMKKLLLSLKNNGKQRGKFETKEIIISSLRESPKNAIELVDITQNALWTIYHHLQDLMKGKVVKKTKVGRKYIYSLI